MASCIQGITVEIGGDTTKLTDALKTVNGEIKGTQTQLKDVEKLLKLDPNNTVLLAQKQALLAQAIEKTAAKLEQLEDAQEQVNAAYEKGDIGKEQYMAFQREIEETKSSLQGYKTELTSMETEQKALEASTQRLQKLFDATGTEVDDYADTLGTKLTNAIKNGTANSEQLKSAMEKIGKAATNGKGDIRQITEALDEVDDGQAIRNLIEELNDVGDAAEDAADDIDEIAESVNSGVLMEAADKLSVVGDKLTALGGKAVEVYSDAENAVTKVTAYFDETGKAAETTAAVINDVYGSGVGDSMDSVAEGVLAVKKNLGDLSQTDLTNITQQALTLDELYGIDMNETLRGVNSLMKQYGMTAQQAMNYIVKGTQNGLDKTNELGDNLSEYAGKFSQAGYSASEYFQLLDNGLKGGAYNLDKVNDAINEVTTRLADGTIGDSLDLYSEKTKNVFTEWQNGKATQKDVIDSIVADISGCTSQQEALNMAAKAFGTMAEDGNLKFITSLTSVGDTYDSVAGAAEGMFESSTTPMQTMEANIRQLQATLQPLGEKLLELANTILPPVAAVIKAIADLFGKLPGPIQNFIIILGILTVAFTAIVPVIAAVAAANTALNISLLPVIGIIAAVAAAIAVIIAVIKNWGAITEWLGGVWEVLKEKCTSIFSAIKEFLSGIWEAISTIFSTVLAVIWTLVSTYFNSYKAIIQMVLTMIQTVITTAWNTIQTIITTVMNAIKTVFTTVWNAIRTIIGAVLSAIKGLITGDFTAVKNSITTIMNTIKSTISTIWNTIKTTVSTILGAIKNAVVSVFSGIVNAIKNAMGNVLGAVRDGFSKVKEHITGLASQAFTWGKDLVMGIVNGIKSCIGAVGDAVKSVADTIRSFLHFSVPDEGPLTDYESWMPDFMGGLAKGIEKSRGMIQKAVSGAASDMVINPKVGADGIVGTQASAQTESLSRMLTAITSAIETINADSGDIVIPVYLGGTMLDEVIVNAQQRMNLRSGGR